ncbi:MAG: Bro-N domain-containing protein [Desulfobacterales bacterium]
MLDGLGFVARDVADMRDYRDSNTITRRLEDFERHTHKVDVAKSTGFIEKREMALINESGPYHAIFKSRKPGAKKFRRWVTDEVLPSIRLSSDDNTRSGSWQIMSVMPLKLAQNMFHRCLN